MTLMSQMPSSASNIVVSNAGRLRVAICFFTNLFVTRNTIISVACKRRCVGSQWQHVLRVALINVFFRNRHDSIAMPSIRDDAHLTHPFEMTSEAAEGVGEVEDNPAEDVWDPEVCIGSLGSGIRYYEWHRTDPGVTVPRLHEKWWIVLQVTVDPEVILPGALGLIADGWFYTIGLPSSGPVTLSTTEADPKRHIVQVRYYSSLSFWAGRFSAEKIEFPVMSHVSLESVVGTSCMECRLPIGGLNDIGVVHGCGHGRHTGCTTALKACYCGFPITSICSFRDDIS